MLYSVRGVYRGVDGEKVLIETGGLTWEIDVPSSILSQLPEPGDSLLLYVYLYHREDVLSLIGFASREERRLFLDLLKVQGVGPRQALRIISSVPVPIFREIIQNEDLARLAKTPGIGKKTAQKLLLTLKGSYVKQGPGGTEKAGPHRELVEALAEMGFDRSRAESVLPDIIQEVSGGESVEGKEQEILRRAIIRLSE
ncbi:Holliday junction ATP-dependent DNA helicase ruvA [Spirochaeta thermophila DSM 6578]|uniref:Holliday junction branch migration complex subunit RuvA n=1 Tax=Winmispira thermophila (strain ATCC 700085 / DSM 6578 / Z-1203) TaxID=869211 RepID=G0GE80_WINT7|nr:Holliday junction branch migration protein RuvA [Spirochaeta thermophila]AEJ61433.1 Holliday junction ATP-dependent DNA helicase ruvA [Spirochaeta thermophila DSM 6578]